MKIYTKQGDKGTSAIYTKTVIRVDKDDTLLDCYGTLDELNSHLGLVAAQFDLMQKVETVSFLQGIQKDIFDIGFALSDTDKLTTEAVNKLEIAIDNMQAELPPQTSFILPGGTILASQIHVTRTINRRAERNLVSVSKSHEVNDIALAYINRLSDYLFVLARHTNKNSGKPDIEI